MGEPRLVGATIVNQSGCQEFFVISLDFHYCSVYCYKLNQIIIFTNTQIRGCIMTDDRVPNSTKIKDKTTDEVEEGKSSLTNPIYWAIALAVVVWWKWDAVLTYLN
tara:strand:+ start:418 stop:735 length:318 start_codon:yes stop_codon:yes gene_type:complete